MTDSAFQTTAELHAHYGEPSERAVKKQLDHVDAHCRNFIALSPFLVIGSSRPGGSSDVSPRGDPPGFVAVLDEHTLLIPDRPGNKRVDTLENVLENPHVALIFLVPGMNETLRVNGRARITTDAEVLAPLSHQGKAPLSGMIVEVDAAYLHCPKALIRSKLWEAEHRIERAGFPSLGRMLADQIGGIDPDQADRDTEEAVRNRLY